MLEEVNKIDQITITETHHILVRRATLILKDGIEISKTFQRVCYSPLDNIDHEDIKIIKIADCIWTREILEQFKNSN